MRRLLAITCLLACVLLVGCASAEPPDETASSAGGNMGMGGEQGSGMLSGAVATSENASLQVGPRASTSRGVRVKEVLAPADGWLVVRSATVPGGVLGKSWVPKGASSDVLVRLEAADGADVRVALHVDRGGRKTFEFDPARPEFSLDKPVVVERQPMEARVTLSEYGVDAMANSVLMLVEDQPVRAGAIKIQYLLLPAPGWIAVNVVENGLPGKQVGLLYRSAGESQQISVPVEGVETGELVVTVLADRGVKGAFEFSASDPQDSLDQPFKSSGVVVSHRIEVR